MSYRDSLYMGQNYTHVRVVYAMIVVNFVQSILLGLILLN